jgi:hypothetical protein
MIRKRLPFNEVAQIYEEIRPSDPPGLNDVLFAMLRSEPEIVEVGPGSGQATKDLLARGASSVTTADACRLNIDEYCFAGHTVTNVLRPAGMWR